MNTPTFIGIFFLCHWFLGLVLLAIGNWKTIVAGAAILIFSGLVIISGCIYDLTGRE